MKKELIEKLENLLNSRFQLDVPEEDFDNITDKFLEITKTDMKPITLVRLLNTVDELKDIIEHGDTHSNEYQKALNRFIVLNDGLSRNEELNRILDSFK